MTFGLDASRAFTPQRAGPENYSYYLIRSLLETGPDHRFRLYLRPDSSKSPDYDAFFRRQTTNNYELKTISWPFLWTQGGLAKACLRNPPDVLFVPAHTLPVIRRSDLPTVVTIHDLGAQYLAAYHQFPQKYYLNWSTIYSLRRATKIITVSQYTLDDVLKRNARDADSLAQKCQVIYEGYDREVYYPRSIDEISRVKEKYQVKGPYFYFQSTVQPRKNLVRLIQAFAKVCHDHSQGEAPQLVIAGKPGWLYSEIYDSPRRFNVTDKVKFLGYVGSVEEAAALMSGALAYIHPSLFEGFSLSILEAMACGVPVITAKVASIPEVGGQAVLYVDPYDVDDIAAKMAQVINFSPEARRSLVEKGLAQAANFSWEKAGEQTLSLLESMVTAPKGVSFRKL